MAWKLNVLLPRVHDPLGTLLESKLKLFAAGQVSIRTKRKEGSAVKSHKRDYIRRFCCKLMCQLLVVRYQMRNVNVAVILLYEDILSQLISVSKDIKSQHSYSGIDKVMQNI